MIVARVVEKLKKYPNVGYTTAAGCVSIPAQKPSGFAVSIQEDGDEFVVAFEGWHERFKDADEALNCFAFGLSTACRLRVLRVGRGTTGGLFNIKTLEDGSTTVRPDCSSSHSGANA